MPLWIAYLDREGRYIVANRRYSETFHKSPDEIEGTHYSAVVPPQLVKMHRPLAQECMQGAAVSFTDDAELDRGGRVYVQGAYVPMFDSDGRIKGCVMAAMDITELRRSEERLLASEARLNEAQRLAHIGNWEYDIKANHVFMVRTRCTGYSRSTRGPSRRPPRPSLRPHTPRIAPRWRRRYADSLASHTAFDTVCRVRTADGRVKFAQAGLAETTHDADGVALRSIGTVQDITPLKQAAEEIRQLNDQLERRVAERTAGAGPCQCRSGVVLLLRVP
ncbi:MAG: PAS domain-containing protein [Comamonadaceae bacterium]|nr:PAS domain-containing protein [Comamonadaceae bacterium]